MGSTRKLHAMSRQKVCGAETLGKHLPFGESRLEPPQLPEPVESTRFFSKETLSVATNCPESLPQRLFAHARIAGFIIYFTLPESIRGRLAVVRAPIIMCSMNIYVMKSHGGDNVMLCHLANRCPRTMPAECASYIIASQARHWPGFQAENYRGGIPYQMRVLRIAVVPLRSVPDNSVVPAACAGASKWFLNCNTCSTLL